jgi:hypothetical protein
LVSAIAVLDLATFEAKRAGSAMAVAGSALSIATAVEPGNVPHAKAAAHSLRIARRVVLLVSGTATPATAAGRLLAAVGQVECNARIATEVASFDVLAELHSQKWFDVRSPWVAPKKPT